MGIIKLELLARIPGLAEELSARLNLWGEEIMRPSGLGAILPFKRSVGKKNTVDTYFLEVLKWLPSKPQRRISGIKLTGWQYHDYILYIAQPSKSGKNNIPNMYNALEDLIENREFRELSINKQIKHVKTIVRRYRAVGRQLVLEKHREIAEKIYERENKRWLEY